MYLFQGNKYLNIYTNIQNFGVGKIFFLPKSLMLTKAAKIQ